MSLRGLSRPGENRVPRKAFDFVLVECIFTWYWLADLCGQEGIPFAHGHVGRRAPASAIHISLSSLIGPVGAGAALYR